MTISHHYYDMDWDYLLHMHTVEAIARLKEFKLTLRVYNPNSLVTADCDLDRLNVEADHNNIITKIIGFG